MRNRARRSVLIGGLVLAAAGAGPLAGQGVSTVEIFDRISAADAATLMVLGRSAGADLDEAAAKQELEQLVAGSRADLDLSSLGPRAAEIITRSRDFRRDVIGALQTAHPSTMVGYLIEEYLSRPEVAFPAAPKNMDVLYDHDSALAFRTRYPELNGVMWASGWFQLAVTEPLIDLRSGGERQAGIDTVSARFRAKLTGTEPPHAHPSELPLAPAIAPGLVWVSPEAAMIWDNHSLFVEVVADILSDPEVEDHVAAIEAAADFFTAPELATTPQLMWETMALRHGIFFQGGYPIAVMTQNERNVNGHGAHMQRGGPTIIPGMGRD